jgi:hypothetical protein
MYYLLLFHRNNGCTNAPYCYVICTLPVLRIICVNFSLETVNIQCV